MSRAPSDRALGAGLVLLTLIAWIPALGGGFVYDDHRFITSNEHLETIDPLTYLTSREAVSSAYDQQADIYRPLRTLSYAIDRAFFDLEPFGYHLSSCLLHALNVAMVLALLRALTVPPGLAAAAAAVFALHPVQVEAVAWISGRADVLVTSLVLAATLTFARARRGDLPMAGAFIVLAGAALLAKENALVLVPLLLVTEPFWPKPASAKRTRAALWLTGIAVSVGYWMLRASVLDRETVSQRPLFGGDWLTHLGYAVNGWARYVQLLVWPSPLATSYPTDTFAPEASRLLGSILTLIVAGGVILWTARQKRIALWTASWFAVALAPVSQLGVVLQSVINERSLYLPAVGGVFAVVLMADRLLARASIRPSQRAVAASLLLLVALWQTWDRVEDWHSDRTLWFAEIESHPNDPAALFGYAAALLAEDRDTEAMPALQRLVNEPRFEGTPQGAFANYELAWLDLEARRFDSALQRYERVYRTWSRSGAPDPAVAAELADRLGRLAERRLAAEPVGSSRGVALATLLTELQPKVARHWTNLIARLTATERSDEVAATLDRAGISGLTAEELAALRELAERQ
ncbi:MAG: hypothetical protein RL885_32670 [Planctomycetota bacterium]